MLTLFLMKHSKKLKQIFKIVRIHKFLLVSVLFLSLQNLNAQEIDSLLLYSQISSSLNNSVTDYLSLDSIWYEEYQDSDSSTINNIFLIKEKRTTLATSKKLRNAYLIWTYYENKKLDIEQKAYLKNAKGIILYDLVIFKKGNSLIVKPNSRIQTDIELLYKQCNLWVKSIAEIGYLETNKKGIKPIPLDFKWCK